MASPKLPSQPGPVIGFTYGTFDLLHDGHRHLLREARARCDQLIVAIDSDRFARELKGPGRPVETMAMRSHNVVATGLVWRVLGIDNHDQLKDAVFYYQPHVVVAGDDEAAPDPDDEGLPFAVVLLPLLPGFSTTNAIKERLQ